MNDAPEIADAKRQRRNQRQREYRARKKAWGQRVGVDLFLADVEALTFLQFYDDGSADHSLALRRLLDNARAVHAWAKAIENPCGSCGRNLVDVAALAHLRSL